jgi:hypothetical protein
VDTDELTIVVAAVAGASPLERDGMLRRLEEAVSEAISDIATRGYLTNGAVDPTAVQLKIAAHGLASPDVLVVIGDAVTALLSDPDVLGWGPFTLNVTAETPDPGEVDQNPPATSDHDEPGPSTADDSPWTIYDPEPRRQRLRADAGHLAAGLDPQWLTSHDIHATDPHERDLAFVEARYVAGALFHAAVVTIDYLFADLEVLTDCDDDTTVATAPDAAFLVLEDLPARYAHRYNAGFVKQFIVATIDVTRRLTADWEPLACVAEEIALAILLNEAEEQLEHAQVDISHWRATLEDYLFEDSDHEIVFDPGLDGIEDDEDFLARTRTAPMAFPEWFTPFNDERPIPPYLLDSSRPKRPAK